MVQADSRSGGGVFGCLKRGCCGCIVVVLGLVLLGVVIGIVMALQGPPPPQPTQDAVEHSIPTDVAPVATAPGEVVASVRPGRVVLDLEEGTFRVSAAPEGTKVRVEAEYDNATHGLTETFTEGADGTWTYRVVFEGRQSFLRAALSGPATSPKVHVILPKGVPLTLAIEASKGESELDLGGLALTSVVTKFELGSHALRFGEPLGATLETLDVRGSMGEWSVEDLGNASPRRAVIKGSMGELRVGLGGAWQAPARVNVDMAFGGAIVDVPPGVPLGEVTRVGGKSTPTAVEQEPAGEGAPIVHLNTHFDFGEIEVRQ